MESSERIITALYQRFLKSSEISRRAKSGFSELSINFVDKKKSSIRIGDRSDEKFGSLEHITLIPF
jgi:hypothetical protein